MEETNSSDEILSEDKLVLLTAVSNNAPMDIVTSLISPSNINMQDENGDTALHVAVREQSWELVRVLLQHGADVNLCGCENQIPLHVAAWRGAPADIITRLITPHNINMLDEDGDTALHGAVRGRRWELVPVLLKHGADVNMCGYRNRTPLHRAAYYGAPEDIISQMISPHNINMQDKLCDTALHVAVDEKRWELVPVLLQHGADPFIRGILPEQPRPLSLQSLTIATIRSHMLVKSDEAFERLGLPQRLLPELKLKPLADQIVAIKQRRDL